MKTGDEIIKTAINTLREEAAAVKNLCNYINDDFVKIVELIYGSDGKVVITGIGKSANIANKIVATLNSTGTPAVFMHAADAVHGDLGNIQKNDMVLFISKSGDTPEIKILVPLIKNMGNHLIAMTGNTASYLAMHADHVLNATVEKEACPNNLAPTSSTTAQLALGDALAVCLLRHRGFTSTDFAKFHPGGALGKKLFLRVADLCAHNQVPAVQVDTGLREVIVEISSKRLGITAVLDQEIMVGVITDGDLRRMLEKGTAIDKCQAKDIMFKNPKTVDMEELAVNALHIMEKHSITQLLVKDKGGYAGVIHLHDLIKEGII